MHKEAARIPQLYSRHARAWTQRRDFELAQHKWLDRFLAAQPARPKVLDIGCGSGRPLGSYLISKGARLTGIDAAPPLIDAAQAQMPGARWQVCDMRSMSLGQRFEGLLAWNSFFHLTPEDQRAMFPRFAAHAAPGAALMFTSGAEHGVAMGEFEGEPLYHASLAPMAYRVLLAENGFELLDHVAEDPDCGQQTIWLARAL